MIHVMLNNKNLFIKELIKQKALSKYVQGKTLLLIKDLAASFKTMEDKCN